MTSPPDPIQPPPRCRDCNIELEPGALLEVSSASTNVVRWTPGVPEPGWFGNEVVHTTHRIALRTLTYRCPKCFRLESFAPPKPD